MGGFGSGRIITLHPGSRAAEKVLKMLRNRGEDTPTCEEMAKALGIGLSAWCLYLKGQRKIPLKAAVAVEKRYKIPVEEWLEKPRTKAAA